MGQGGDCGMEVYEAGGDFGPGVALQGGFDGGIGLSGLSVVGGRGLGGDCLLIVVGCVG
jgi:hypothetical protein